MASPAPASTATGPAAQKPKTGSPNDFLKGVIGKRVNVRLNSGIDYQGVLSCLDGYMNIALEQTAEYVDGVHKNSYGDAFIRGNNGKYSTRARLPHHLLTLPKQSCISPLWTSSYLPYGRLFSPDTAQHHFHDPSKCVIRTVHGRSVRYNRSL